MLETLLKFMLLVVVPALTGIGSYVMCREVKRPLESFIQAIVGSSIILLPMTWVVLTSFDTTLDLHVTTLDVSGGKFLLFLAALLALVLSLGGHIDEIVAGRVDPDWFSSHFLLYAATMVSLIVGTINVVLISKLPLDSLPFLSWRSSWMMYLTLLAVSPSLTPTIIWATRNLMRLPGFRTQANFKSKV
jgi:hypothetical protein